MVFAYFRARTGWTDVIRRTVREIDDDRCLGLAAQLAFYFLLALFPFLIFLTSILGLILGSGNDTRQMLFDYLARVMPPSAFQLISQTMIEVSSASSGGKISFGLLAALWAASNGMTAITTSLNSAYDVEETRPWWKQRLTAIALTMSLRLARPALSPRGGAYPAVAGSAGEPRDRDLRHEGDQLYPAGYAGGSR